MGNHTGNCAYCGKYDDLEESHILPKWTIRRALRGSVTGKLRESENVNQRVQDGEKIYLLCRDCEHGFSKLEGPAARDFDAGRIAHGAVYTSDFVRFLALILWRVATVRATVLQGEYPKFAAALVVALQVWKDVLEGKRTDFAGHPIWFIMLGTDLAAAVDRFMKSESPDGRGAAPVINRYFANNFGAEVAVFEDEGVALIWAKTTSWLIVGVLTAPTDPAAASVELALGGGVFPATGHSVPEATLACLGYQSWQYLEKASEMRSDQRQKIKDDWTKNVGKVAASDQTRAMQADIAMFGAAAYVNVPEPDVE